MSEYEHPTRVITAEDVRRAAEIARLQLAARTCHLLGYRLTAWRLQHLARRLGQRV